ncbi:MAG: hypothetical protein U0X91_24980 [Spirosomataceae bacterium]
MNTVRQLSMAMMAVFAFGIAQGQSTSDEKKTKAQKLKERKAQADSLLQKAGIATPDLGVGATVAGKSIKPSDAKDFFTEKLPDLGLKVKELRKQEKARRLKKKKYHTDYEGLSIVRMTTSTGSGDRIIQVEFHVLKEYRQPRTYDGLEVFWYDSRNRIVSKSAIKDKEAAQILHGPYKRYVSGNLVEEGNYYVGTKDGRWETYDADYRLLDKTKWKRGFPAESMVSYYDSAHTKVREVIPVQYGKRKGDYLMFYDGGQLMVKGQYDNDLPVGTWNEYYQYRRQRKKVTRYPRYWYEDGEGVLLSEWDEKGKLIYERPKDAAGDTEDTEK